MQDNKMSINFKVFIIFQTLALAFYMLRYTCAYQWKISQDFFTPQLCNLILYLGGTLFIILGVGVNAQSNFNHYEPKTGSIASITSGIVIIIITVTGIANKFLSIFYKDYKRFKLYYYTMCALIAVIASLTGIGFLFLGQPLP